MKKFFPSTFCAILLLALISTAYGQTETIFIPAGGTGVSPAAGKIGIGTGTSAPTEVLDVNGNLTLRSGSRHISVGSSYSLSFKTGTATRMFISSAGTATRVGIGTTSPAVELDVNGASAATYFKARVNTSGGGNGLYELCTATGIKRWSIGYSDVEAGTNSGSNFSIFRYGFVGGTDGLYLGRPLIINRETGKWTIGGDVVFNHNVGIGTEARPEYKLAVNGKIIATEIVVKEYGNWPDYVFANNYNLRSLGEVENFINENGHLPEVPSAKAVEETGVGVGEMNAVLLKKVEELTLYAIQQEKFIKNLEERISQLEGSKQ